MWEVCLRIRTIEEAKRLVELVSKVSGAVTLESDCYIVDAKSIMGVLSLDLTQKLTLKADTAFSGELSRQLKAYLV